MRFSSRFFSGKRAKRGALHLFDLAGVERETETALSGALYPHGEREPAAPGDHLV